MGKNMRKFLSVVLATALCVCLSVTAYARYINEITARCVLDISGGTATLYSEMVGDTDVTTVVMTHSLQKKSGSSYSDVPGLKKTRTFYNDNAPTMTDTFTVSDSGTYRVKTTYKVTSKKGTDNHTAYSKAVVY